MTVLKNAARMERMLLRDHTIYATETITPLGLPQDFVSNQLIAVSGGMADKRPFQTSTDGNCLFNSASIATFGDQSKAAELRVLTCLEMLEHSDYYKRQHKTTGLHILPLKTTTKQLSIVPLTVTSRVPGQFMLCLLS